MELRRQTSPGKFEGGLIIDELAHDLLQFYCDDEVGDTSYSGEWYGLRYGPFGEDAVPMARLSELGYTADELAYLASVAGYIIRVDDAGFVSVEWYDTHEKLESVWMSLVESFSTDDDDDDESEG